jgi:hypothetical protein
MNPQIHKWLDLIDRVGWTALQATAGAIVAYLATDEIGWKEGFIFVATAAGAAVVKVVIGQNTGSDASGSLIGQPVIEPHPVSEPEPEPEPVKPEPEPEPVKTTTATKAPTTTSKTTQKKP